MRRTGNKRERERERKREKERESERERERAWKSQRRAAETDRFTRKYKADANVTAV